MIAFAQRKTPTFIQMTIQWSHERRSLAVKACAEIFQGWAANAKVGGGLPRSVYTPAISRSGQESSGWPWAGKLALIQVNSFCLASIEVDVHAGERPSKAWARGWAPPKENECSMAAEYGQGTKAKIKITVNLFSPSKDGIKTNPRETLYSLAGNHWVCSHTAISWLLQQAQKHSYSLRGLRKVESYNASHLCYQAQCF